MGLCQKSCNALLWTCTISSQRHLCRSSSCKWNGNCGCYYQPRCHRLTRSTYACCQHCKGGFVNIVIHHTLDNKHHVEKSVLCESSSFMTQCTHTQKSLIMNVAMVHTYKWSQKVANYVFLVTIQDNYWKSKYLLLENNGGDNILMLTSMPQNNNFL